EAVSSMTALNATASRLMQEAGAHACTDITGFGLLGHAAEMMELSHVGMQLEWAAVPLLPRVEVLARGGFIPAGAYRNRDFRASQLKLAPGLPDYVREVLFDPQTSGGLLIALPKEKARKLVQKLHGAGITAAAVIGTVLAQPEGIMAIS
ncbi:MAG: AIR synthase-related protein, partial [Candidatus Thermoplasmatota archaeon]